MFSEKKGDQHNSPCKVIEYSSSKKIFFEFLISFFNVRIFNDYVK